MAAQISSYQPSFLVSQDPSRFGNKQEDYLHKSELAIASASRKIVLARQEGRNLSELFFEIIADLSQARSQIALEHETEDAEVFGIRRDKYYPAQTSILVLEDVYGEYNQKILLFFAKHLIAMELKDSPGIFQETLMIEDNCNGLRTILQFEVLDQNDLIDRNYHLPSFMHVPKTILMENPSADFTEWTAEEIDHFREKFRQFKKEDPEGYNRLRMSSSITSINRECPPPGFFEIHPDEVWDMFSDEEEAIEILNNMKSLYVHATLKACIDNQMIPMTEYFTWMFESDEWLEDGGYADHPIKGMLEKSKVMLLHQDEFLIKETLDKCAKIFESAVTWNPQNQTLEQLKDTVALLYYLATHNMRDVRGSAAETEWLESAIYRSLNISHCVDRTDGMMDLEAFANPLFSNFREEYHRRVDLELLKP